jgi:hypothetical protein
VIALLTSLALAGPLARVDLIAEDPGTWLVYDVPSGNTTAIGVRFITQLKPVWRTPWEGVTLGTSIASQSLSYERPLTEKLSANAGLQTRLLLPAGATASLAYYPGKVRLAAGVSLISSASWANPDWSSWHALPALGLGFGGRP